MINWNKNLAVHFGTVTHLRRIQGAYGQNKYTCNVTATNPSRGKKKIVKVDSTNNLTFNLRAQPRDDVTLHLAEAEEQRQRQRCDSVANASGALQTRSDTVGSSPRKRQVAATAVFTR